MVEAREKWILESPVPKTEPVPFPASPVYEAAKPIKKILKSSFTVCLLVFLLSVGGVIGWFSSELAHQPDYSEVIAEFKKSGHPDDAERLDELMRICPNSSGTKLACRLVYFATNHDIAEAGNR